MPQEDRHSRSRSPRIKTEGSVRRARDHSGDEEPPKEKPNFELSGKLAAASNQKRGIALKYQEPHDCALPRRPWRCYVYSGKKEVDMLELSNQSAYLFGRDRLVVDVPLQHESCSKQHAVLQFRSSSRTDEYGNSQRRIKLYVIDLESTNGTTVNRKEIPLSKYYEVRSEDTINFGDDPLDYVLLEVRT